jgi:hypothetical protein
VVSGNRLNLNNGEIKHWISGHFHNEGQQM